jgi:hypothetical protein
MADRYSIWQAENAGTSSGPTIAQVLFLLATITAFLLALAWSPLATQGGRPARVQACQDLQRLEAMGVRQGSNHRVLEELCHGR